MKRRHFFLLSLFSIVRPAVSFAGQPSHNLESLRRKLEAVSSFSCTFRQTKTLLGQNFSLVSTGTLEVQKGHLLIWNQKTPFVQTFRIVDGTATISIEGGKEEKLNPQNNEIFNLFITAVKNIIEGRFDSLGQYFEVSLNGNESAWLAHLTPLNGHSVFGKAFKEIVVKGSKFINYIEFVERNSDCTNIYFSNISANQHGRKSASLS